ncbi:MAG: hypothetical protein GX256_08530 [Fretibacterium sp.]|nr:hypothetical protein [Fretibacterium sp.]
MIRRMVRVVVWGVSNRKSAIVDRLYDLGVLHAKAEEDSSHPLLETLRAQRARILALLEALGWDKWRGLTEPFIENVRYNLSDDLEVMVKEVELSLGRLQSRLDLIRNEREEVHGNLLELHRARFILSNAQAFLDQERFTGGEVAIWKLSRTGQHHVVARINGELDLLPSGREKPWFRHHTFQIRDGAAYLVTSASREVQSRLASLVLRHQGVRWHPPQNFAGLRLPDVGSHIRRSLKELSLQRQNKRQELSKLASQWGSTLAALYVLLDERLERLLMETIAVDNGNFFSLEGWMPEDKAEQTAAVLHEDFGDAVLLRWRQPDPALDSDVPTALKNRPFFKPFELFLKLLNIPHYEAYDPTPLIAIFFPFFAGCMVGDAGYGLILLWLGWWLKQKKSEILSDLGVILLFVAVWSLGWGLVYGEFFGDLGLRLLGLKPLWVERSHAVLPVMVFTIALGGAHILLGLLIGVFQGFRMRNRHMWMERLGTLLVIVALVMSLAFLRSGLPSAMFSAPVALLVFALIFLIWGGGVGGLVESLSALGNIISYVRIAAIGLSSAILAMVAGTFVDIFGVSLLGLFMAFAIHLLNFILAIGGASLHASRLHYVEFLGKFYQTGELKYKPFARRVRRELG